MRSVGYCECSIWKKADMLGSLLVLHRSKCVVGGLYAFLEMRHA